MSSKHFVLQIARCGINASTHFGRKIIAGVAKWLEKSPLTTGPPTGPGDRFKWGLFCNVYPG
jgi:hypothetical protein